MPGLVTRKFRIHNATQFKEAFSEAAASVIYLFIGGVTPWTNETAPPTPADTISDTEYRYWRSMLAAKRVQTGDVSFAIPRYDWTTAKVYREWNSESSTLFSTPASSNTFYVVTSDYNVYKCLFNNKGAASTVMPTGTSTSTLVTADGYHWKFMYSISAADALKYATTAFIPVQTLTANNGTSQWSVQEAAANGSIDVVDVTAGGSGYLQHTGVFASVANSTTLSIASGASGSDNIYNGSSLYIASGLGAGQLRQIVDYTGSSKTLRLSSALSITPNTSSTYIVGPTVSIRGDGQSATAYANVTSGALNYINMVNKGTDYSKATVVITANTSHGTGATAIAYISPKGGHGADPINELDGRNIMMNVQLSGSESDTFPTTNDFRIVGLLKDPLLVSNGAIATGSSYDQTTRLTLTGISGSALYQGDELVVGSTSTATARVVSFANTNSANTAGILRVSSSNAVFVAAETLTANTTGITATITSIAYGSLENMTGEVIYVENRTPVSRSSDQIEDIKLVVKF